MIFFSDCVVYSNSTLQEGKVSTPLKDVVTTCWEEFDNGM